jgi:hypothetical protein
VVKNPDELRGADVAKAARQRVTRIPNVVVHRDTNRCASTEVQIGIVSALCQMTRKELGKHRRLRGHRDAHRGRVKSLIESALVGFGVRQHARLESISKRAPSSASARVAFIASSGEMSRRSGFAA